MIIKKLLLTLVALTLLLPVSGKAASLTNASDTISEVVYTRLTVAAMAGDNIVEVFNADRIDVGDIIFLKNSGVTEYQNVLAKMQNQLIVNPLINSYPQASDLSVLSGIKHSFNFTTKTTARVDKIVIKYIDEANSDQGSLASANFGVVNGVALDPTPNHQFLADQVVYDVDETVILSEGSVVNLELENVLNPNGITTKSYAINIATYNDANQIIDTVTVIFSVDTSVTVEAFIQTFLEIVIEDNGTKNNFYDSITGADIVLGRGHLDILDDSLIGYGIDGNKIRVSTNNYLGYNLSINDDTVGLRGVGYTGTGRPINVNDERVDDLSAYGLIWPSSGTEAYGYTVNNFFDTTGVGLYNPFIITPVLIWQAFTPVFNDTVYVTVRSQILPSTVPAEYTDIVTYTVLPNI